MSVKPSSASGILAAVVLASSCLLSIPAGFARPSQDSPKPDQDKPSKPQPPEQVTIHIEVTGGEHDKPIENASIYVRFNESRKLRSDKLVEMNVKTSQEGKVKVPLVPKGKILIQVVAENWKTFGRWFDLTEDGQVFKIHLDRPHKWY